MINHLPADFRRGLLLGRLLTAEGPTPVLVRGGRVLDVSRTAPTSSQLLSMPDPAEVDGRDLGPIEQLGLRRAWEAPDAPLRLLSPFDLQCVKASGVTFAVSALE